MADVVARHSEAQTGCPVTRIYRPHRPILPPRQPEAPVTHVVVVSQHFHPEVASTGQLLTDLAVELQRRGMTIRVVTAQPSHAGQPPQPAQEFYQSVEIERISVPYTDKRRVFGRVIGALTFSLLVLWRLMRADRRSVLLIVTNPPILPLVGWVLKKLRGQRYVILVNDIYPDIAVRLGYLRPDGWAARLWTRLNRWIYQNADRIVALERRMAERIAATVGETAVHPRIEVIHNWPYPDSLLPVPKEDNWFSRQHGLDGKLIVAYAGNMGMYHDLETLLGAARQLADREEILFLFIGDGGKRQKVADLVRQWGLPNVRMLPYQPREHLLYSLTCGDVAAVTLARGAEGLCMPSRLYTALAAGQGILAVVDRESEVGEIIEAYRCGHRVDPGDVDGVVAALRRWVQEPESLEAMKRNARRCYEQRFTKQHAIQQYYDMLSQVGVN